MLKLLFFLSLGELDCCTLRQKHPDCAEDWVICELCVRQAQPNPFFWVNVQSVCYFNQYYYSSTTTAATTTATLLLLLLLQQVQPLLLPRVLCL